MTVTDLSWMDALDFVRASRNVVDPNAGFRKQLENYEETSLREV